MHRVLRPRAQVWCSRHQLADAPRDLGDARRSRSCLAVVVPKGFFPQQDTGCILGVSEAAPDVSFPKMMELQQRARRRRPDRIPTSQSVASFIGSDGTNPTTNSGRLSITLKPRDERTASAERDHRAPPAEARAGRRASTSTCSRCRTCRSTAASAARSTSTRSRTPTRTSSPTWAPKLLERAAQGCPSSATWRATRRPPASRCRSTIDRDTASRLGHLAAGHRRHALRRLRPAAGLDHLHAAEPLPRHPRGEARVSARTPRRSTRSTCATPTGDAGAAQRVRPRGDDDGAARHQPSGAVPGGHALVQPRAAATSLGDAVDGDPGGAGARSGCRRACTPTSGHRAGLRRVARERAAAHPRRDHHRLHRARRPLRELHPPDHDPLDAALGGRRRAPRAHGLPDGLQRHRAHRDHPAHRHREEERDHDDRLRARGGARPGDDARARRSTRRACCASGRS